MVVSQHLLWWASIDIENTKSSSKVVTQPTLAKMPRLKSVLSRSEAFKGYGSDAAINHATHCAKTESPNNQDH